MLKKLIFAIALLVSVSGFAFCQSNLLQSDTSFKKADKVDSADNESFQFDLAGYHYRIAADGKGIRTSPHSPDLAFDLNLLSKLYERIESLLYFTRYKGDLLLICETELDDSGSGIVRRLDGESLKIKWEQRIKAFNIGPGLINGDYAYLTGIGFVGKVNLRTGKYEWKHESLYRKGDGSYNSFALPTRAKSKIIFQESHGSSIIEVDDQSGKILRMDR